MIYYYLADDGTAWLITIYNKVRKENLTSVEMKIIKDIVEKIKGQ
jgi:hypothetical protein